MIPRVNLLDALINKDMFCPSILNNCLNRAATGSNKGSSIVSDIKPQYFDGWDIKTSFVCYGNCLIKVFVDAIDDLMRIIGDIKNADIIMIHRRS